MAAAWQRLVQRARKGELQLEAPFTIQHVDWANMAEYVEEAAAAAIDAEEEAEEELGDGAASHESADEGDAAGADTNTAAH